MRYAFVGYRPGQSFVIPGFPVALETNAIDGGVQLTPEQHELIESQGYELTLVADVAPDAPVVIDPIAQANIEANGQAAREAAIQHGAVTAPAVPKPKRARE